MKYSDDFLTALGRWQRGWRQDPVARKLIGLTLSREASLLPDFVRQHDGAPLYRKRNLYRRSDQRELVPLFLYGSLDEGGATSWSKSSAFAEKFGRIFDDTDSNSTAGAIFCHVPIQGEIILNLSQLWGDPDFESAATSYRDRKGAEAQALFYFRGERDQCEVIMHAPLRANEIWRLGRSTTYDSLYDSFGAVTDEQKSVFDALAQAAGVDVLAARYLSVESTARVVERVVSSQRGRIESWMEKRTPTSITVVFSCEHVWRWLDELFASMTMR